MAMDDTNKTWFIQSTDAKRGQRRTQTHGESAQKAFRHVGDDNANEEDDCIEPVRAEKQ